MTLTPGDTFSAVMDTHDKQQQKSTIGHIKILNKDKVSIIAFSFVSGSNMAQHSIASDLVFILKLNILFIIGVFLH